MNMNKPPKLPRWVRRLLGIPVWVRISHDEEVELSWVNVCYPHAWPGDWHKMRQATLTLGYPLFIWNGIIRRTSDNHDTGYRLEDIT